MQKYLALLVRASHDKKVWFKNQYGQMEARYTSRAVLNEMMRPPFISTAPKTKRVWSEQEIAEFYQKNPLLKCN